VLEHMIAEVGDLIESRSPELVEQARVIVQCPWRGIDESVIWEAPG